MKRNLVLLFCLWFFAQGIQADIKLGNLSRSILDGRFVYLLPIAVNIDGYSTIRAQLQGDQGFLADIDGKMMLDQGNRVFYRFAAPLHLEEQLIAVTIGYQGQKSTKAYRLKPHNRANITEKEIPQKCAEQWMLEGSLILNIRRIVKVCGFALGEWPHANNEEWIDFIVPQNYPLSAPGDLPEFLRHIADTYALEAVIFNREGYLGTINFKKIARR